MFSRAVGVRKSDVFIPSKAQFIINMTQGLAMHCVTFVLMLISTQSNTRIDSDSIFTFLYIAFLCLITKKSEYFCVLHTRHNAVQALASYSELA